jgi:hypothetical protein
MKPNLVKSDTVDIDKLILKLNTLFSRMGIDNLDSKFFSGTTSATPEDPFMVKHGLSPRPRAVFVTIGDIYVKSIDNDVIDVRSSKASEPFEILAIRQ